MKAPLSCFSTFLETKASEVNFNIVGATFLKEVARLYLVCLFVNSVGGAVG